MLHVAAAAFVALVQQHFLFSGLGGVIAAVVGGVIAAVVVRANKRSAPNPAPIPQPAPDRERHAPSGGYTQPTPPPSASRRLHAGPIEFTEPTPPQQEGDEDDSSPAGTATLPIMPSNDRLIADWREREAPPLFQPHSTLWNRKPFARPEQLDPGAESFAGQTTPAEPPIWRVGFVGASDRPDEASSLADAPSTAQTPPLWSTWLHAPTGDALTTRAADEASAESAPASGAPIWPTYLRPE